MMRYIGRMPHAVALALLVLWTVGNFYLWALKQPPLVLFWESLALGLPAFAALFFYAKASTK